MNVWDAAIAAKKVMSETERTQVESLREWLERNDKTPWNMLALHCTSNGDASPATMFGIAARLALAFGERLQSEKGENATQGSDSAND